MHVMVNVVYVAEDRGDGPEQRVVITGLFDFFDVSARELTKRATLKYGSRANLRQFWRVLAGGAGLRQKSSAR